MRTGIFVCGLNGAGKSTLGRALAQKLGFYFIDNEDLYFPKTDPNYLYASSRTREEVEGLLLGELARHEQVVFTTVKGDYGERVCAAFQYIVLIEVPKEVRLQRIQKRSFEKFGARMLPGGDLYRQEEGFFVFAAARPETLAEEWAHGMECPCLRVDGTRPVAENAARIVGWLQGQGLEPVKENL